MSRFSSMLIALILLQCFYGMYCLEDLTNEAIESDLLDPESADALDEEYEIDLEVEQMYSVIQKMYNSISNGDARYFSLLLKQLANDTFAPYILDEDIIDALESTFVHILNTMQLVSEISIKINASPMQINTMNDALFLVLKSMIKFLKASELNTLITDDATSAVNLLLCEGVSLSLQYRLIRTLKYLLIPSVMNNTEQYYCFNSYHNILNQTYFHLAAKSRASGFIRLFFNMPASLPVMKYLHINNKALLRTINRNNPIINQEMVKKRVSDIDVLIIFKHAFKLNMPNEWFLRKDINHKSAFHLWIDRAPFYLRHVYFHSVISKLFSTHHRHISVDNNSCISMRYVAKYWPTIQWFPIPVDSDTKDDIQHNVLQVNDVKEFNNVFPAKWFEQKPVIFREAMYEAWNLSDLQLTELNDILADEVFMTSDIPYQDLYDNQYMDQETAAKDREKRSVSFRNFTNKYFDATQSTDLETKCNELKEMNKLRKKKKNQDMEINVPYVFDNSVYWKNMKFAEKFNLTQLIPEYIYQLMQNMIDDYESKIDDDIEDGSRFDLQLDEMVDSIVMLKQLAIGGMFSGAQPHFHGPAFNALLMGQKQWIIFPPNKTFQMKQTALQFFCYHENLTEQKKEKLTYHTFTQNVGDVVFIPKEWGHAVLNIQPSIAVAVELFI